MTVLTQQVLRLCLIASLTLLTAESIASATSLAQSDKSQSTNKGEISVMVSRKPPSADQTFNPPVRLNEDTLIEIQPTSEFSRGLAEMLIEQLQKSEAFSVYDQDEESDEIPDGVEYVLKARVVSISITTEHGNGRANKLCRFIKCSQSLRDAIARIKLSSETVTFTVKVAITATQADSKRVVYARSFTESVTARANSLSDTEADFGVKALRSPAASMASHKAIAKGVDDLARRLASE